jgi:hypothetical protein
VALLGLTRDGDEGLNSILPAIERTRMTFADFDHWSAWESADLGPEDALLYGQVPLWVR